jgi:hypothetical protein
MMRAEQERVIFRPIAFVVTAFVVVIGLWLFFKPQRLEPRMADSARAAGVEAPRVSNVAAPGAALPAPAAVPAVFELVIKGGRLVSGPAVIQVREGERVALHIRSDRGDELHLHGYDLHAQIRPGETASLQFTADRTGRFDLELHKANAELGALEVYPQ